MLPPCDTFGYQYLHICLFNYLISCVKLSPSFFRSLCELIKENLLIWGHSSFHSFAFWAAVQCQSLIINNQFHQVTAEIQPIADTQRVNLALTPGWKWPFKTNLGIYKTIDRLSLCAELPAPCCCWLGVFF